MTRFAALGVLATAALLEAGGDAFIRIGMKSSSLPMRVGLFVIAALVLFAYGWTVNSPPWDFGKLLGLYVVFFFIFAQLISWLLFKQLPSKALIIGGAFILTGGLIIASAD